MVTAIIIWFLRWTSWCKNVSVSAWAIFVKNWWRINGAEQKFKKLITQTTCIIMRHNHVLHNLVNHKKITPNFLAEGVKCVARCVTSFLLKFENSSILMDGNYAHKWDSKKQVDFFGKNESRFDKMMHVSNFIVVIFESWPIAASTGFVNIQVLLIKIVTVFVVSFGIKITDLRVGRIARSGWRLHMHIWGYAASFMRCGRLLAVTDGFHSGHPFHSGYSQTALSIILWPEPWYGCNKQLFKICHWGLSLVYIDKCQLWRKHFMLDQKLSSVIKL